MIWYYVVRMYGRVEYILAAGLQCMEESTKRLRTAEQTPKIPPV